jgi:hypothetical protein
VITLGNVAPLAATNSPKPQVMDQQNASFLAGLSHNIAIWYALQTPVGEMHRIVPKCV